MRALITVTFFALCACGSGITQSAECKKYLACTEAASPGSSGQYGPSYGESGSCWSTDRADADSCTVACVQGLDRLRSGLGATKTECQ